MDLLPHVYMIRSGDFGTDFVAKLSLALFAVVLVGWDVWRQRRLDYLWVLLFGTVTWTVVELVMQAQGVRVIRDGTLWGSPLPPAAMALIQGASEGAAIAVGGVFFGDRILHHPTRLVAALSLAGLFSLVVLVTLRQAGSGAVAAAHAVDPASRRDMLTPQALVFLCGMVALAALAWWRRPALRPRLVAMTLVILTFATIWTVAEVAVGTRGIQVPAPGGVGFAAAPAGTAIAALAYDVVVEITLAYVPFLGLPVLLGRIRPEPIPSEPIRPGAPPGA